MTTLRIVALLLAANTAVFVVGVLGGVGSKRCLIAHLDINSIDDISGDLDIVILWNSVSENFKQEIPALSS